ncbi:isoprenylcysteine carboxylmethyltransferase family protein [Clostridium sp. JS66]|nr:isoprenylcysteine carboxylmethyltransferase family protein [Clostridium sp. JS66]
MYYSKLTKKGAVTGGIYKYIRHPQYISLIICSLGLLLIWSRYIVLVSFITMIFVYYFLAQAEEQECCNKFGKSYIAYMNSTNMFIPFIKFNRKSITISSASKTVRIFKILTLYIITLIVSLSIAYGLQNLTIDSLYSSYTDHSANISLCKMNDGTISKVMDIAEENSEFKAYLNNYNKDTFYLNYILPTTWFAAEVPMNGLVYHAGHKSPDDYDKTEYKIIFTKAVLKEGSPTSVKDILTHLDVRYGIVEVWIDLKTNAVTKVLPMPKNVKYNGIPEALY